MTDKYDVCFAGANPTVEGLKAAESAANAISENPRNASLTIPIGSGTLAAPTERPSLAAYTSKFWIPGRQLKVSFLTGTDFQKNKVKQYAPAWCSYANISMTFVDSGDCDILIDFNPTLGSWSYIGTDCIYFSSQRKATMNLGWIFDNRPEEQLRQVVLHEFGHALGAVHEHESPLATIPWNKDNVYRDLGGPPNNWSRAQVDQNMFTLYTLQEVQASDFDRASIMLYQYPASWTTNGQGTTFNSDLSAGDKEYIHFVYPPNDLDAGQFNTQEIRQWDHPALQNTKTKYFWKKYPTAPRVPVGLTSLDIDCGANIRITAGATNITQEKFTAELNAWSDTTLYSAGLTYLEAGPGFEYIQTGVFNTQEVGAWQNHAPKNSKRINFPTPFQGQPPKIICWLTSLDMDKKANWRCTTFATDIDTNGFTVHIDTWADTVMYSAGMTWLAYPSGQANVSSGSFNTQDVRPWDKPQPDNSATVSFGTSFNKTPKLIMAVNSIDYDHSRNLRLRLSTSSVTQTGMTWHLQSWWDSIMYSAGASYFAWT